MSEARRRRRIVQRELVASVKRKMVEEIQSGVPEAQVYEKYILQARDQLNKVINESTEIPTDTNAD